MSVKYPTKKEIKQYLVNTFKDYLIHLKLLIIHPLSHDKSSEYCCLLCASNDSKKLRKHNKKTGIRYDNLSHNMIQSDFINMLQARHPIKDNTNFYINTQLDPVIRNLWLYKPIRDIYRQTIKETANQYYSTYVLVRHKCGHRYIDKIIRSADRKRFISELKFLRRCSCNNCTDIENKHILLRWFDWKFNSTKSEILKYSRHIGHRLTNKPNLSCVKCMKHALRKHQKHKVVMKF